MDTAMKLAMDTAVRAGADRGLREFQAMEEAKAAVRPFVGDVLACDSAAGVYKTALGLMGQDTAALPPSAMRAMFEVLRRRGARPRVATDAVALKARAERFPDAGRLHAGRP